MAINYFMWILRFINVVMNMYKVNIIGYMRLVNVMNVCMVWSGFGFGLVALNNHR